jgi:hypothetical protein
MQTTEPQGEVRRARLKLALMFLAPALVVLLATLVYYTGLGVPRATTNKGVLLQPPRQIDELALRTADGTAWRYADARRGWGILLAGGPGCDARCQERITLTRQVRTALGDDTQRVRRYYLASGAPLEVAFADFLAAGHPDLQVLQADAAAVQALLGRSGDPAPGTSGAFYLVDPRGFVMMYYLPDQAGRATLDDLRFLLRNSPG